MKVDANSYISDKWKDLGGRIAHQGTICQRNINLTKTELDFFICQVKRDRLLIDELLKETIKHIVACNKE